MSELVDPVAKAIRAHGSVRYGSDWDTIPDDAKEMFRQDARAAIAAIRIALDAYDVEDWPTVLRDALK